MVSPDYVKQLQLEKQLKCWTVMSYDRKSVLNENDSTDVELSDSIERLQSALRAIMSEMVFVRLRPNTKAERGKGGNANSETYDLVVKINNSPAQQPNLTGPTWNDYQALNNKYLEVQIERLRLELSDNKESITDQLIKALASNPRLVGSIAGAIERIAGGPAIAAPPQTYQVQNTLQSPNNDVNTAAQRLQELIPDKPIGEILTKMAAFLEANQGQIPQILSIISPD